MSKAAKAKSKTKTTANASDRRRRCNELVGLFGPPPLIAGESRKNYMAMLDRVIADVKPVGVIEEILVRDVVDLTWDIFRLRSFRANILNAEQSEALYTCLMKFYSDEKEIRAYIDAWVSNVDGSQEDIDDLLAPFAKTTDSFLNEAMQRLYGILKRLDGLMTVTEARRNAVLREIDRRRASLSLALRNSEIIEGEFKEIEKPKVETASG